MFVDFMRNLCFQGFQNFDGFNGFLIFFHGFLKTIPRYPSPDTLRILKTVQTIPWCPSRIPWKPQKLSPGDSQGTPRGRPGDAQGTLSASGGAHGDAQGTIRGNLFVTGDAQGTPRERPGDTHGTIRGARFVPGKHRCKYVKGMMVLFWIHDEFVLIF